MPQKKVVYFIYDFSGYPGIPPVGSEILCHALRPAPMGDEVGEACDRVLDVLDVGSITDLRAGFNESGEKMLAPCWRQVKRSKCFLVLNLYERG